jgi:RNA polymerase sigma factor (sigma-70 family)
MGMPSASRRTAGSVLTSPVLQRAPGPEIDAVFMAMFNEHRDQIYSTALRLTGRRLDAEDLTAETFLRAYRSLSSFDEERLETLQPRAWLSTIVLNLWRNHCRDASRRPAQVSATEVEGPDPVDVFPGVEQQAELHEDGRRLASMLIDLPERQRVAVVLRYIVDLPVGDIATVMGCPAGTVKSLISRGLDRLRPDGPSAVIRPVTDEGGNR